MPGVAARWATQAVCQKFCMFHTLLPKKPGSWTVLTKTTNITARELYKLKQEVLYNHWSWLFLLKEVLVQWMKASAVHMFHKMSLMSMPSPNIFRLQPGKFIRLHCYSLNHLKAFWVLYLGNVWTGSLQTTILDFIPLNFNNYYLFIFLDTPLIKYLISKVFQ